jgi:hypothetical protein
MVVRAVPAGAVRPRQRDVLMTARPDDGGETGPSVPASSDRRDAVTAFFALTGIATTSALCVVAGVALGWFLDQRVGTPHVFVFLGLIAGVAAAVGSSVSIAKRYLKP